MKILKPGHSIVASKLTEYYTELFWDIEVKKLKLEEHSTLIITQVLNYGSLAAIQHLFKVYTSEAMRAALEQPVRGCWYPRTYKAFCILLDAEPKSYAVNKMLVRKKEPDAMSLFFKNL